jgi:hypothetical protein
MKHLSIVKPAFAMLSLLSVRGMSAAVGSAISKKATFGAGILSNMLFMLGTNPFRHVKLPS